MVFNDSRISSADSLEPDFTKVSSKQLLRFKSTLIPPSSLSRVREQWSRGQRAAGESLAQGPAFWGGLWWKRFPGRGSALLDVGDFNGNAFSVQQQAAEELFFIFLFLSPPQGKDGVKETHTRNISRKGWLKQSQSCPQRRGSKPGNELFQPVAKKQSVKQLNPFDDHPLEGQGKSADPQYPTVPPQLV